MRAPDFWTRAGLPAALLSPAAALYALGRHLHGARARPVNAPVPVICVGNLTVGGSGKTPVALSIAEHLQARGSEVHFLTRGHRGRLRGPVSVDPGRHSAREVGDEALLLARAARTWVARDRARGALEAAAAGADAIVMDDGFQNPSLVKDLSILVVDGGYGFGNRRLLPAGPLREDLAGGLARAQRGGLHRGSPSPATSCPCRATPTRPWFAARLVPGREAMRLAGRKVVAFAGIGRPQKFFDTLRAIGARVVMAKAYPDHHAYDADEIMRLVEIASESGATPVTTEKDRVRLPPEAHGMVEAVPVFVQYGEAGACERMLGPLGRDRRLTVARDAG